MNVTPGELESYLAQFTGTLEYHKDPFTGLNCTDGVMGMAQKAGAFWLVTDISLMWASKFRNIEVQFWTLEVADKKANLTMREDSNKPVLYKKNYSYTDFPDGKWNLYLMNGVLLLPSEY